MVPVPFDRKKIEAISQKLQVDLSKASIREMNALVNEVEQCFDTKFIRMEFGIPGLPASAIGAEAEREALVDCGVANTYAPFQGIEALKKAGSRFVKAFVDLDIPPDCVIPTLGAMHGCFIALALAGSLRADKNTILFLDPGFPVNKLQTRFLGLKSINLDLKDFRGEALLAEVDRLCREHGVGGCLWSSPNNPAWVVLTEKELAGLAEVFNRHQVAAIEDMAYFGMDFRQDYSVPYQAPFQPSIARYMDRVFMIISSSKLFSYAGQRCGLAVIPPGFAQQRFENLIQRFSKSGVLSAFIQGGVYPTTAGVPQGPQWGLAAILDAVVDGRYNPWDQVKEYERRAVFMKKAFTDNGFYLVYDRDQEKPLADGFYFTVAYPGMDGSQLSAELVHYGISAITLLVTGSQYTDGLRACVSLTGEDQFETLAYRLARFHEDHPIS